MQGIPARISTDWKMSKAKQSPCHMGSRDAYIQMTWDVHVRITTSVLKPNLNPEALLFYVCKAALGDEPQKEAPRILINNLKRIFQTRFYFKKNRNISACAGGEGKQ